MSLFYVICWSYSDGSAYGTVSAHLTKEGADRMLQILNAQDGMRLYRIEFVLCDECPKT